MTLDEWLDSQRINGGPHGFECVGRERMEQVWDAAQLSCKAREKVLRELLPKVLPNDFISFGKYYAEASSKFMNESDPMSKFKGRYLAECEAALAQPSDDSALKAALAAERERCALAIENIALTTGAVCAKRIRALGD